MKTVVIQIGNSDDKLPQSRWHWFIKDVQQAVRMFCEQVHFNGSSAGDALYQNYCMVAEVLESREIALTQNLAHLAKKYDQDSIAVTFGETIFVKDNT
ncbi:MAG: hypothetical protein F6K48_03400 [Okeania sp. SIO3H1]|nr:hypothetical protein [Okeania sp. SIO3H1]